MDFVFIEQGINNKTHHKLLIYIITNRYPGYIPIMKIWVCINKSTILNFIIITYWIIENILNMTIQNSY